MTDYTELKRLAEAATPGEWASKPGTEFWTISSPLRHEVARVELPFKASAAQEQANASFIAAANPAAILALIAENERLKTLRSKKERELEQELEVWHRGPSCWSCGDTGDVHDMVGEWRGKCDCLAAKLIDASSERDRLKAEVEALRKDAARYHWLRDKSESVHQFYMSTPIWFTGVKFSKENVDNTIDAAMSKEAGRD